MSAHRRFAVPLAACALLALGAPVAPARADDANVQEFQRRLAKGLMLAGTGQLAEAVVLLRRAHNLLPKRFDVLLQIAALEARVGNTTDAERILQRVVEEHPNEAMALRELGIFYLEQDRDLEALNLLERACEKAPSDGSAQYARGLALSEFGREDQAREAWRLAARFSPMLATQALTAVAGSLERTNDLAGAKLALEQAIAAASDPEATKAARKHLAELGTKKKSDRKIWRVAMRFATEFDSNVSLLADPNAVAPGTGSTAGAAAAPARETARATLDLDLSFSPVEGRHNFDFGFNFLQSKHLPAAWEGGFVPPSFDQTVGSLYLAYAFQGRAGPLPFRAEVAGGHSATWLDVWGSPRHFLQNPWLRPSVVFTYKPWGELRVAYRLGIEDYLNGNKEDTPDDRDGIQHLGAIENTFFLGRRGKVRATVLGAYYGADGRRWTAVLSGGALDGQWAPARWVQASAGFAVLRRDYTNSDYTRTLANAKIETIKRSDSSYFVFTRLAFPRLRPNLSVYYSYSRNDSTLAELFGFRRHIAGVDLRWGF